MWTTGLVNFLSIHFCRYLESELTPFGLSSVSFYICKL